jgi:hypothetical protein
MTTDDTLELDTIIENSSRASNPINKIDTNANYNKDDLKGIETHTSVFDPPESGEYEIYVNGQVLSINVTDASAIPDAVVFEPVSDALTHFDGMTSDHSIVSSPTLKDGQNVLQSEYAGAIYSTSGLDAYPRVGYRHQVWVQGTENANPRVRFGVQDSSSYYSISFDENSNELRILKNGNKKTTTSTTIDQDTTYIFDWYWRSSSPNIEAKLFNGGENPKLDTPNATLSLDDTDYTSGGVGFRVGRGRGNDNSPIAYFEDCWRSEPI